MENTFFRKRYVCMLLAGVMAGTVSAGGAYAADDLTVISGLRITDEDALETLKYLDTGKVRISGNSVDLSGHFDDLKYIVEAGSHEWDKKDAALTEVSDNSIRISESTVEEDFTVLFSKGDDARISGNNITLNRLAVEDHDSELVYLTSYGDAENTFSVTSNTINIDTVTQKDDDFRVFLVNESLHAKTNLDFSGNAVSVRGNSVFAREFVGARINLETNSSVNLSGNTFSAENGSFNDFYGISARMDREPGNIGKGAFTVSRNTAKLSESVVRDDLHLVEFKGSRSDAAVSQNRLEADGIRAGEVTLADIQSDHGNILISKNVLKLKDSEIERIIAGGTAFSSLSGTSESSGNLVELSNVTQSGSENANKTIIAGKAYSSEKAVASGNTIILDGGKYTGDLIAGLAENSKTKPGISIARDNTVILRGDIAFGSDTVIHGGVADQSEGNLLLLESKNIKAKGIDRFQKIEFSLGSDIATNDTLLTLSDEKGTDLRGVTMNVTARNGEALAFDEITLIKNADGLKVDDSQLGKTVIAGSAFVTRTGTIGKTDTDLSLKLEGERTLRKESKALAEGTMAGLAVVSEAADLAAGDGLRAALRPKDGFSAFAAAAYSETEYDTGSNVDVDGYSVLMGGSFNGKTNGMPFMAGVFVEAGHGAYDSFNGFASGSVTGDGESDYTGAGLLARLQLSESGYADASLRFGRVETDFSSGNLLAEEFGPASYDVKSDYFGLHAGGGYVFGLTSSTSLDLYGRYFLLHIEGDTDTVAGERVDFKSIDSHRVRFGARCTTKHKSFTAYTGAALDWEFDGEGGASIAGMSVESPELEGATGLFEIGMQFAEVADLPITLEVGMKGYAGEREGFSGNLSLNYLF